MDFNKSVQDNYLLLYNTMIVNPKHQHEVDDLITIAKKNQVLYQGVCDKVHATIPWYFVAVVHYMECGFSFQRHLHNGDPLSGYTKQVPAGRPKTHKPPFTFEESAVDALVYQGLDKEKDWSIPKILYYLEAYNGYGYRSKGINSPYLWSFTSNYKAGKYIADHVYSSTAVSTQCGSAPILRGLIG